jgi:transposase
MAGAVLTPEDRAYFLVAMRRQGNSAVHCRMNALLLLDDGWTAERVAAALFIEAETVRAHRRFYSAGGRAGVEWLAYAGHAPILAEAQMAELSAELSGRLYPTAKAVCGLVAERFGLAYSPHAMACLLGRIGVVWKRPQVVPAKADAAAQRGTVSVTDILKVAGSNPAPASQDRAEAAPCVTGEVVTPRCRRFPYRPSASRNLPCVTPAQTPRRQKRCKGMGRIGVTATSSRSAGVPSARRASCAPIATPMARPRPL